jgi:uncharacterized phage protein (TIGR02218 family)
MTQVIPIKLLSTYKSDVVPITTVVRLILRTGEVMGFTSFDQDINFDDEPNITYKAFSGINNPTAVSTTNAFNVDNLDTEGFLDDETITESDIQAGRYDYADIEFGELDWTDKPYSWSKVRNKRTGKLGEINVDGYKFKAEIRGLMVYLQGNIGDLYQPGCRASFGDSKCFYKGSIWNQPTQTIDKFQSTGTVTAVSLNKYITCNLTNPTGVFNNGKITFLTGLNQTLSFEIKKWDLATKVLEIQLPANYLISPDDTFQALYGCDGTIDQCEKYGNARNFRGEPFIPQNSDIVR